MTVFTKNRDRLLDAEVAARFMTAVLAHGEIKLLLSNDHFSVDGTLIDGESKSIRAKMARTNRRSQAATGNAISKVRGDGTIPMRALPIPMLSSTARATARRRSSATSGVPWSRTGTALSSRQGLKLSNYGARLRVA